MPLAAQPYRAYFLLILVNLIYGANYTIAKSIMPRYIGPYGFIFFRVFVSLILFAIIYLVLLREKVLRKDWPRFIACGLFGIAINQLFFFKGISLTSSIHGALLMITTPIITYILSHFLVKKRPQKQKILGISMGVLGAGILILSSVKESRNASILGDLLVMLNAISFSIYLILVKPLLRRYHPLTITFFVFLTGSIWVAFFGYKEALHTNFRELPTNFYWSFGYVILAATFLVYLFNNIALQSVSASSVSSFIYLQPLFTIIISSIFTNERLTIYSSLGGILIIFGLWLINKNNQ